MYSVLNLLIILAFLSFGKSYDENGIKIKRRNNLTTMFNFRKKFNQWWWIERNVRRRRNTDVTVCHGI